MRAGQLRHRVAIQTATESANSHGDTVKSWSTAATRWMRIEPLSGDEATIGERTDGRHRYKFTMRRYTGTLTRSDRLLWSSRAFNIESIQRMPDVRNIMDEIIAIEDVT